MMRNKVLSLMFSSLILLVACKDKQTAQAPEVPPPEVSVVEIKAQKVQVPVEFVGQVFGAEDIAIRARVEGFLEGIHFQEGSDVEAGQLLYTLESQPYEADVAAMMSKVAEAKTMLAKATSDLNRIRPLAKRKAVSQSDLDSAVAQYEAARASVQAAQANLKASKINLSYTRIESPINGLIGKTNAKVGDFVGRSPNPVILNVVSNTATVRVEFFLTENQYLQVARRIRELELMEKGQKPAEATSQRLPIELYLADGTHYPEKGKFDFIDRNIDPTTGSILVQVSFPNPERLIRPGQFARIRTIAQVIEDGILIPQRSVMELQGLHNVFVVDDNNTVITREIKAGDKVGSMWLIEEGLKPGEKVIYEGLQKAKDGATVNPTVVDLKTENQEKK